MEAMTDEEVGKMVRGLLGALDLDPREWSSGRKGSSGVGGAVETVQVSDRLLQLVSATQTVSPNQAMWLEEEEKNSKLVLISLEI